MNIINSIIDPNPASRPCKKLIEVRALIVHWTAMPGQTAKQVRGFYQNRKSSQDGFGSAQFALNFDGTILQILPEDELAYAVGSSQPDPASGKIYTDLARQVFGTFAQDPKNTSPNWVSLSVEWMTTDDLGNFTQKEYDAGVEFYATRCIRYRLNPMTRILTHREVVGWKNCHRFFVDHPDKFNIFKQDVREKVIELGGSEI